MFRGLGKVIWSPLLRLNVYGSLSANHWDRDIGGQEQFFGAAVGADWTIRQLTAGLRLEHNSYENRLSRAENRLIFRVSRKF